MPKKSLPNVYQLVKEAINDYNFEIGRLSLPELATAETVTTSSGMNYTSVMTTLAKGQIISDCLFLPPKKFDKFHLKSGKIKKIKALY